MNLKLQNLKMELAHNLERDIYFTPVTGTAATLEALNV